MIAKPDDDTSTYDSQAQILRVLIHPARLAILDLLRDGEHCVCHLEAHLGYRQAFISQHLGVMRTAGIVLDRRAGWNIYYRVADPRLFPILDAIREISGVPEPPGTGTGVICPCPHCNEAGLAPIKNAPETEINQSSMEAKHADR